jgi:hypothetical protein
MTDLNATGQGFYIENKNVGNKATSEDWRSKHDPGSFKA